MPNYCFAAIVHFRWTWPIRDAGGMFRSGGNSRAKLARFSETSVPAARWGGPASLPPQTPPFGRCAASNLQYVCYLEAWGDVREFLLILRNLQFHCSYAQFLGTHYPGLNFLLLYKHLEHYFSIFSNFFSKIIISVYIIAFPRRSQN